MAKHKKRVILDVDAFEFKKRLGRKPTAPAVRTHKDKSKYTRKEKYKPQY